MSGYSKTYLVSWPEVEKNVIFTCMQLDLAGLDRMVFNVGEPNEMFGWVNAEKVRYYGHFYNALADFVRSDAEVFIFNAGDPMYDVHDQFTLKVERLFRSDPDLWVLAPSFPDGTIFQEWRMHLADSKLHQGDGLVLASMTDGIWSALRREVAAVLYEAMTWMLEKNILDFKTMHSGWGLDYCYCAYTMSQGRKVYRDMSVEMLHKPGSSYGGNSMGELNRLLAGFKAYLVKHGREEDSERVWWLFGLIADKLKKGKGYRPSLTEIFGKEIDY